MLTNPIAGASNTVCKCSIVNLKGCRNLRLLKGKCVPGGRGGWGGKMTDLTFTVFLPAPLLK